MASLHQFLSRIGYTRRTGIRYQSNVCPGLNLIDQFHGLIHFIIFMIAGHGGLYPVMVQQFYAVPGILSGYQIHRLQGIQHPERDIFQIADGGGTQIQYSLAHTRPPFLSPAEG